MLWRAVKELRVCIHYYTCVFITTRVSCTLYSTSIFNSKGVLVRWRVVTEVHVCLYYYTFVFCIIILHLFYDIFSVQMERGVRVVGISKVGTRVSLSLHVCLDMRIMICNVRE